MLGEHYLKPDIVYIHGKYSEWRDQEIKYSLRSLEKYGRNYNNVYLIGEPSHYVDNSVIKFYHYEESPFDNKEKRIMDKILYACSIDEISNPFVMFNDDFFLVKPINFSELEYYYQYDLEEKIKRRKTDDYYKRAMKNTKEALENRGLPTKHFDIHYPILYDKTKFIEVMNSYDWKIGGGYVIKSLYCNTLRIEGKEKADRKIYISHDIKEIRHYASESDLISTAEITRAMASFFIENYPEVSTFEKIF